MSKIVTDDLLCCLSYTLLLLRAWSMSWFVSVIHANRYPYFSLLACALLCRRCNLIFHSFCLCTWFFFLADKFVKLGITDSVTGEIYYFYFTYKILTFSCKQRFYMKPCWTLLFSTSVLATLFYPYGWRILKVTKSISLKIRLT